MRRALFERCAAVQTMKTIASAKKLEFKVKRRLLRYMTSNLMNAQLLDPYIAPLNKKFLRKLYWSHQNDQ